MRVAQLTELFRQTAVVDEVDVPRGDQIELLSTVAAMYAKAGLIIDGDAPPLWDCCPRSGECWRTALDPRPSRADGRAGVALPWIGPAYRLGGVAVVALNLRDAGGLLVEYAITCRTAGEGSQLSCLAAGSRMAHRSRVAYASARSAGAIQDWIYGESIRDRKNPTDLVEVLDATVRLQAVKCSPQDGGRSTPTDAMSSNCPPLLLEAELAILKPRGLLVLGTAAWHAVEAMAGYTEDGWGDRLSRGRLQAGVDEIVAFSLDHPAAGGLWDRGHRQLVANLRGAPLN